MIISKTTAQRLILQGKAQTLGLIFEGDKTYALVFRLDTGHTDRYLVGPGDRRRKLAILAALLLLPFISADATSRPRSRIDLEYIPQANGDYRLYLFGGGRLLVCEEKTIQIIQQGDAVNPLVIECRH